MSTFERDKQDVAIAAQKEANITTYQAWVVKHPEFYDCEANRNMLFGTYGYMDFTDPLSESDLDFAYGNLKTHLALQHVPTPEETKAALIDKICSLIASSNEGRDGKFDSHNLNTERTKMNFWSIQELATRLEDVMRKQSLASKPIGELQQIVQSARKYVGYPQLGKTVVPPGTVHAVNLNAAYLQSLDAYALKRLCRLYGIEQVNNRLAGKE